MRGWIVRQGGWALMDQALSSGTNFGAGVLVARLLGPPGYGSFVFAFTAWVVSMGLFRATVVKPYLISAPSLPEAEWRTVTMHASGASLVLGGGAGLTVGLIGLALGMGNPTGRGLMVLAAFIPVLHLQDFWRYAAFCRGQASRAAANDAVWAVVEVAMLVAIWRLGIASAPMAVLAWGTGALAGAAFGVWQFKLVPLVGKQILSWVRTVAGVSGWFGVSEIVYTSSSQLLLVLVGAVAGRGAVGGLTGARSLVGPAQLVSNSAESVSVPFAARIRDRDGSVGVRRVAMRYTLVVGSALGVYGVTLLLAGPVLLRVVFGHSFAPFRSLIVPVVVVFLAGAAGCGAAVGLVSVGAGRALASVVTAVAVAQMVFVGALVTPFGVVGAAWGLALGSLLQPLLLWLKLLSMTSGGPTIVAHVGSNLAIGSAVSLNHEAATRTVDSVTSQH